MNENLKIEQLITAAVESLQKINSTVFRDDQFRCHELELTISQVHFLRVLYEKGTTTMGKISEALSIAPPSATMTAERLVKQGIVVRKESKKDRRVVQVSLSAKGKRLISKFMEAKRRRWFEIMKNLPENDRESLVRALQLLVTLMEKAEEEKNHLDQPSAKQ
ncbi:MAG: MarR family transcriptional regulator [Firmicutes bacterium]|nr:MarR family transcriptional regulator [Bacillota bacterium]